jgi:hypothetical protein
LQPISRILFIWQNWSNLPIQQYLLIPPSLGPWQPPFFLSLWIRLLQVPHVNRVMQYLPHFT